MARLLVAVVLGLTLAASHGSEAGGAKRYRVAFVSDVGGVGPPIMQQQKAPRTPS
jgi:hypothetical protein